MMEAIENDLRQVQTSVGRMPAAEMSIQGGN